MSVVVLMLILMHMSMFETELIFVTDITVYICGEKIVMWRNFGFLYRIWTIYGVLSKFMLFLLQIYVEKMCVEKICEEKKWQIWGLYERCSEVNFVHAVTANGSVIFLPAV